MNEQKLTVQDLNSLKTDELQKCYFRRKYGEVEASKTLISGAYENTQDKPLYYTIPHEKITPQTLNQLIGDNNNLYEMIITDQPRRFYFDLDHKSTENLKINYDLLNAFIVSFMEFIHTEYNIKCKYPTVHITTDAMGNIDFKNITSSHLIFNDLGTKTHKEMKLIIRHFKEWFYEINGQQNLFFKHDICDFMVYSKNRQFRTINQSKNGANKQLKRIIYDSVSKKCRIENRPNKNDLITFINHEITFLNPKIDIIESKNEYSNIHKIHYEIPYIYKLWNKEHGMTQIKVDLTDTKIWRETLYKLIYAIIMNNGGSTGGVAPNTIDTTHNVIKWFIEKSKVGKYNTTEYEKSNIEFIRNAINRCYTETQKFIYEIPPLKDDIIKFIIDKCGYTPNKIFYREIQHKPFYYWFKDHKMNMYNSKTNVLIFNASIIENHYIDSENEICYTLWRDGASDITSDIAINKPQHIKVYNLTDIPTENIGNSYIQAPVGSGKTYNILRRYIKHVLSVDNSKIKCYNDTISLSYALKKTICEIVNDMGLNSDELVYHYQHKKLPHENVRVIITTYDSLRKFNNIKETHIICDEFKNTLKRTVNIQDKQMTEYDRSKIQTEFLNTFNECEFLLLDADYDDEMKDIMSGVMGYDIKHYELIHHNNSEKVRLLHNYKTNLLNNHKELQQTTEHENSTKKQSRGVVEQMIIDNIRDGENIAIACGSKKYANYLFNMFLSVFQTRLKIVKIDAEGAMWSIHGIIKQDTKHKKELCENTELWKKYQVVIYTPTIQTGISFNDRSYFHRVYAYVCGGASDTTQTAQFLHRVRGTIYNELNIFNDPRLISTIGQYEIPQRKEHHNQLLKRIINKRKCEMKIMFESLDNAILSSLKEILGLQQHDSIESLINKLNQQKANKSINPIYQKSKLWIEKQELIRDKLFLYDLLKRLKTWGFHISTEIYKIDPKYKDAITHEIEKEDIQNAMLNALKIADFTDTYDMEQFKESEYLDDETYQRLYIYYTTQPADDTTDYKNFKKTLFLKQNGISKYGYDVVESAYAEDNCLTIKDEIDPKQKALVNMWFLDAINETIEKIRANKNLNDITTQLIKSKHRKLKMNYGKLFNQYITFNVFNILGIDWERLGDLFKNGYSILREEIPNELNKFILENSDIIDYLNFYNKVKTRHTKTNEFKYINYALKNILSTFKISYTFGREKADTITRRTHTLTTKNEMRISKIKDWDECDKLEYLQHKRVEYLTIPKLHFRSYTSLYDIIHTILNEKQLYMIFKRMEKDTFKMEQYSEQNYKLLEQLGGQ